MLRQIPSAIRFLEVSSFDPSMDSRLRGNDGFSVTLVFSSRHSRIERPEHSKKTAKATSCWIFFCLDFHPGKPASTGVPRRRNTIRPIADHSIHRISALVRKSTGSESEGRVM